MKNFAIITDSCSDLGENLRTKYGIDYIPMHILFDDKDIPASLDWEYIPLKEFYDLMRKGKRIKTAQIIADEYRKKFEEYLEKGEDILYIACSSGLSASFNTSLSVRDEMLKKYPDSKVVCVDSLNSCLGQGLICISASKLREEGKTIEEVAEYTEKNKLRMNQFCTVESLAYLKREIGRASCRERV